MADAKRYVSGPLTFPRLSEAYDSLLLDASEEKLREEMEYLSIALGDSKTGVDPGHRIAAPIAALGRASVTVPTVSAELREFCRLAADRGMVFDFQRPPIDGNGNGSTRLDEDAWTGTVQAVTLNLPQAFYRSEGVSDLYAELDNSIALAVKAHQQKRQLLRKVVDRESGTFGQGIGWVADGTGVIKFDTCGYAIGLAGLSETVKLMTGEETIETEAATRLAFRIVSYVFFRIQEEAARLGMRLALEEIPPGDVLDRFGRIDAQMYARARSILADRTRYTPGFRVRGPSTFESLAVEARFHTLVPTAHAATDRMRFSPTDLFAVLTRLHAETLASRLAVE